MELSSTISILILGFLVLVFGSILRRRATDQLQFWFLGWVFSLLRLLAGLVGPRIGVADQITFSLSSSATILAGISFIIAVSMTCNNFRARTWLAAAVATPALLYINAVALNFIAKPLLIAILIGGLAGVLAVLWSLNPRANRQFLCGASVCVALTALAIASITRGEFASGSYRMQAGLFIIGGVLFHRRFQRWTIGPITATLGFLAWGGSLLGVEPDKFGLSNTLVLGAAWNAPAYVAALGMILTVLDEQIREAAEAGRRCRSTCARPSPSGKPSTAP